MVALTSGSSLVDSISSTLFPVMRSHKYHRMVTGLLNLDEGQVKLSLSQEGTSHFNVSEEIKKSTFSG